jgi:hypothetical protein
VTLVDSLPKLALGQSSAALGESEGPVSILKVQCECDHHYQNAGLWCKMRVLDTL